MRSINVNMWVQKVNVVMANLNLKLIIKFHLVLGELMKSLTLKFYAVCTTNIITSLLMVICTNQKSMFEKIEVTDDRVILLSRNDREGM